MEGKWKDGKGDVALRIVEYYGNVWLDLRIMNTTAGKNQHTRHLSKRGRCYRASQKPLNVLKTCEKRKSENQLTNQKRYLNQQ